MDTTALGWSCFGLFLMAMFLEFIRAGRMEIERNAIANRKGSILFMKFVGKKFFNYTLLAVRFVQIN